MVFINSSFFSLPVGGEGGLQEGGGCAGAARWEAQGQGGGGEGVAMGAVPRGRRLKVHCGPLKA